MTIEVKILKAFVKDGKGGNPAGIVYNEKDLNDSEKQRIASRVGLSETVFINSLEEYLFDVSFFTPNKEVDLCGHGTIAAFQLLRDKDLISDGIFKQKTKAGDLDIIVTKDDEILMEQKQPEFLKIIENRAEIANSLGITINDLHEELPIQIVSTGLEDLIIGVKNNNVLNGLKPDFDKINKISEKYDVTGYHVFSLESLTEEYANCRNFAPYYGINEEGATGTASGALASYLYHYDKINLNDLDSIVFYQGEKMGVHSEIHVKLKTKDEEIEKIFVGGNAVLFSTKKITI